MQRPWLGANSAHAAEPLAVAGQQVARHSGTGVCQGHQSRSCCDPRGCHKKPKAFLKGITRSPLRAGPPAPGGSRPNRQRRSWRPPARLPPHGCGPPSSIEGELIARRQRFFRAFAFAWLNVSWVVNVCGQLLTGSGERDHAAPAAHSADLRQLPAASVEDLDRLANRVGLGPAQNTSRTWPSR